MKKLNKADKQLIKKINKINILNIIREDIKSRADIAKLSRLNPATVSTLVGELINEGLVRELGIGESSGGRKPILLELDDSNRFAIAIDMGIEKFNIGIIDIQGKIKVKEIIEFNKNGTVENKINTMIEAVDNILKDNPLYENKVIGIGLGLHGLVHSKEKIWTYAPAFNKYNLNIGEIFQERFNMDIEIQNDSKAMAIGEKLWGAGRDIKDFILINIGHGIGSGIYVDGNLYEGKNYGAGEVGHIPISDEKLKCSCGKYGCLESVASGNGIKNLFLNKIKEGRKSPLLEKIKDIEKITAKEIYMEALNKDSLCDEIMTQASDYLALAISIIVNIINPEKILLAGGVLNAKEYMGDRLKNIVEKRVLIDCTDLYIGEGHLKDDAGLIGAASLIISKIFKIE